MEALQLVWHGVLLATLLIPTDFSSSLGGGDTRCLSPSWSVLTPIVRIQAVTWQAKSKRALAPSGQHWPHTHSYTPAQAGEVCPCRARSIQQAPAACLPPTAGGQAPAALHAWRQMQL
eukprot:774731-Pelagomonas_calceolata.AAC.2